MNIHRRNHPSLLNRENLTFFLVLFFLQGCEVINPEEQVPSYLQIDSASLITTYATEGSSMSNFSDAWVYINENYLGTYEYPFSIPVLGQGVQKISIRAGIKENGMSGVRAAYSKTNTFDTTLNLQPNQTNLIRPQVTYLQGTVFCQLEDFDDGSLSLISTTANTALFSITSSSDPNALEGNSGYVLLDNNHSFFEFASATPFVLPVTIPVYVELDYKCTVEFTIGVFVSSATGIVQSQVINIRPSATWNKIYVNLSTGGGIFNNAIDYKIYLKSSLPLGQSSAEIYLDNLKVLY